MDRHQHDTMSLEKFDKEVIRANGLNCPWCSGDVDLQTVKQCHRDKGWKDLGKFREHIYRKHGYYSGCMWCGAAWTPSSKDVAKEKKDEHMANCEWEKKGQRNPDAKHKEERMTAVQQLAYEDVKRLTTEDDLERIYKACGKSIPDCYHVNPLVKMELNPTDLPIEALSSSPPDSKRQPNLFKGFTPPEVSEFGVLPPTLHRRVTPQILTQVQNVDQRCQPHITPSGADADKDQRDSGYEGSSGMSDNIPGFVADSSGHMDDSSGFVSETSMLTGDQLQPEFSFDDFPPLELSRSPSIPEHDFGPILRDEDLVDFY